MSIPGLYYSQSNPLQGETTQETNKMPTLNPVPSSIGRNPYNLNRRKRPDFRKCRGYHEYLAVFDANPANDGRAPIPCHVFYALRYVYSIEAMEAMARGLWNWTYTDTDPSTIEAIRG